MKKLATFIIVYCKFFFLVALFVFELTRTGNDTHICCKSGQTL